MSTHTLSIRTRHFFHVVSNVRPIAWIGLYIGLIPLFALIYQILPDGQFRIPDGGDTDFGSWLYYSIVTISTLGFGDYTPAHGWAQAVTAIEVMCGLVILGFFLNAVGSMKSEIDVESELERQRILHEATERDKLIKTIPAILSVINRFLEYSGRYSQTNSTHDRNRLISSAARASLCLDSMQSRIDLSQWPVLLENCFTFVADYQLYISTDKPDDALRASASPEIDSATSTTQPTSPSSDSQTSSTHTEDFLHRAARVALTIESELSKILATSRPEPKQ